MPSEPQILIVDDEAVMMLTAKGDPVVEDNKVVLCEVENLAAV